MFGFVSFRGRAQVLLAAAGPVSLAGAADAALLAGYAVGSGENTSSVIVDFVFDGGDAYLFEYNYDGNATAADMLLALDAAGGLDLDVGSFGTQIFINGFSYDGNSSTPNFATTGSFWQYWLADEPVADPAALTSAGTGPSLREIGDGSLDAWRVNISQYNSLGLDPTEDTPPTAFSAATIAQVSSTLALVPEPGSAALLALAGSVLLRRRRA